MDIRPTARKKEGSGEYSPPHKDLLSAGLRIRVIKFFWKRIIFSTFLTIITMQNNIRNFMETVVKNACGQLILRSVLLNPGADS